MKRILSFSLALLLCLGLIIPVSAARNGVYILDEMEHLSSESYASLHQRALELSDEFGIDLLVVFTYEGDLAEYGQGLTIGQRENQIMMLENGAEWEILLIGNMEGLLSEDDLYELREAYDNEPTYSTALQSYYDALGKMLAQRMDTYENRSDAGEGSLLVDQADLLSQQEEQLLRDKLNEISTRQKMDVVIVTAISLEGKTPAQYADDFFDFHGYGFGANYDGVLLLVSFEDREQYISTHGYGIEAFTDAGIKHLYNRYLSYLSDGEYAQAFDIFAESCDEFITKARNGNPYDVNNLPKGSFKFMKSLLISLAIGFAVALIVVMVMRGQLKSVRSQTGAADYVKKGSLNVTRRQDLFLYRKVDRRAKPQNSGGGSSTHRSSSGRTHGGGGSKF